LTIFAKKKQNPYEKLAKTLNRIPNGFAPVEDGSHLKVLEWVFEPEEAEIACKMKLTGETLKKLSRRLKIPIEILSEKIDTMKKKGQIRVVHTKKGLKYGILPFVIGFYEDQLHRMDAEFAQIIEDYFTKSRGEILFSESPAIHRVVPVKSVIKTDLAIHPRNEAEKMVRNAKSWGIRECICRKQQELIGNSCKYSMSVCLSFSSRENAYKDSNAMEPITLDEALNVLKEAEDAGLIHTTMNVNEGQNYICNCCTCCCGVLSALVKFDQPNAITNSDYIIYVDEESCTGCENCIDRCQFKALEIINDKSTVNEKCVGCGVCAVVCPENALSLIPRKPSEIEKPPKNITFWMIKRAIRRKINLFKVL